MWRNRKGEKNHEKGLYLRFVSDLTFKRKLEMNCLIFRTVCAKELFSYMCRTVIPF